MGGGGGGGGGIRVKGHTRDASVLCCFICPDSSSDLIRPLQGFDNEALHGRGSYPEQL